MDDRKLISLVQSNEHIYSRNLLDYKNVHKKKKAWSKIAQEMGESEEFCMKRWASLRDSYVKEKRRINKVSDSSSSSLANRYSFPHLDTMTFLDPFVIPRPSRRSKYGEHITTLPKLVEIVQQPIQQSSQQSPNYEPEHISTNERQSEEPIEPLKIWSEALETFKQVCQTREENARKEREQNKVLINFEKMLVSTIGSLSRMKQAYAMQQVTDVVMKIKMETGAELGDLNPD